MIMHDVYAVRIGVRKLFFWCGRQGKEKPAPAEYQVDPVQGRADKGDVLSFSVHVPLMAGHRPTSNKLYSITLPPRRAK